MEDLPLVRLQRLRDLLGPGLWLTVDRKAFNRLFGHDIDPRRLKAAKDFAKDCGCTFVFDADKDEIRFGRAHEASRICETMASPVSATTY
jgi:NAD(P)H-hydrate repair Nnr-like enzyme with NAD(P)H-hydrate dehydratase domain